MEASRVQPLVQMRDVWTVADVQTLDVDEWWRYEVVDGALIVSPSAGREHELVSAEIRAAIWQALPAGQVVVGPMSVAMSPSYFIPDLVVTERALMRGAEPLKPADVSLVVEIVSPGSATMDRVVKPAKYAAAGITAFWRLEIAPVSLTAYRLPAGADVYTEVGRWHAGEIARIAEPFQVEIDIGPLTG
jgi:Uma2 family endonuclease